MGKQKPFSLRDFLDIEAALTSLGEALTAGDEMKLEALVARLAEEPKQILALSGHELVEWSRDAVMAIIIALTRKRDYRPGRKLELAAAYLLHWLESLQRHAPAGWGKEPPGWPFEWENEIRHALFSFVTSHYSLKAESTRNARRKGGKVMASKRRAEKAAQHTNIRKEEAKFRASDMAREAAAILAKRHNLSTSQIRRIVKHKPS